jgi:hypothetical protein
MRNLIIALTLLTLISSIQAQNGAKPMSRATALNILKGCATRPITLGCDENTAEYLITLYKLGDKSVLKPLFDAGLTSDGALSETLGDFYSQVLWKSPREMLEALRSRPTKEQRSLSKLAGSVDGSGMPNNMLRDVRRSLSRIASQRNDRLASVARICLVEINTANLK